MVAGSIFSYDRKYLLVYDLLILYKKNPAKAGFSGIEYFSELVCAECLFIPNPFPFIHIEYPVNTICVGKIESEFSGCCFWQG